MKKKPQKLGSKDELPYFFQTFIGEFVQLTMDVNVQTVLEMEEGDAVQSSPLVIQGFLLDQDDKFYYIGENPDNVESAVDISSVKAITIVKHKTVYDEILDEMPNPENDEEIN